jgi:uncharacterized protein YdaU (DUF1376 family)
VRSLDLDRDRLFHRRLDHERAAMAAESDARAEAAATQREAQGAAHAAAAAAALEGRYVQVGLAGRPNSWTGRAEA